MSRRCFWWFLVVGGLLTLNGYWAVARFQVNALFGDQWNFYQPLFDGVGWWEIFTWQHGPHRQGLAFVLTAILQEWSGWDARIESLWIFGQLMVATGLAVGLKYRLVGRIEMVDIWIVVGGLSLISYETILLVPNASHSVFPLLGVLVAAHLWPKRMTLISGLGLGLVAGVLMFTGFGMFGGGMIALLLVMMAVHSEPGQARWGAVVGILVVVGSLVMFVFGYLFTASSEGYRFPHHAVGEYVDFVALMLAGRMGFDGAQGIAYLCGGLALVLSLTGLLGAWRRYRITEQRQLAFVVFLLIGSSLAFVGFTAIGRVHLGITAGQASRYMPLLFPIWLGVDLLVSRSNLGWWRWGFSAFAIMMAVGPWVHLKDRVVKDWPGTIGLRTGDLNNLRSFQAGKMAWVDAVLQHEDWREAERIAPRGVFPFVETVSMGAKLDFMSSEKRSFYAESETSLAWLPWIPDRSVQWLRPAKGGAQRIADPSARVIVRSRRDGWINIRAAGASDFISEIDVNWGKRVGRLPARALSNGISFPIEAGDRVLELMTARSPKSTNLRMRFPTITEIPTHQEWDWRNGELHQLRRLEIRRGFYGWEEGETFGWTSEELGSEVTAHGASFLNIMVESRFAPIDRGPIAIRFGDAEWEIDLVDAQRGVSLAVPDDGITRKLSLGNPAGAMSPQAAGKWDDTRPLALRLQRLTVDASAVYAMLERAKANDRAKSP